MLKSLPAALMRKVVGQLTPSRSAAVAPDKYVYAQDCSDAVTSHCVFSDAFSVETPKDDKTWKKPDAQLGPNVRQPANSASKTQGSIRVTSKELLGMMAARVAEDDI